MDRSFFSYHRLYEDASPRLIVRHADVSVNQTDTYAVSSTNGSFYHLLGAEQASPRRMGTPVTTPVRAEPHITDDPLREAKGMLVGIVLSVAVWGLLLWLV